MSNTSKKQEILEFVYGSPERHLEDTEIEPMTCTHCGYGYAVKSETLCEACKENKNILAAILDQYRDEIVDGVPENGLTSDGYDRRYDAIIIWKHLQKQTGAGLTGLKGNQAENMPVGVGTISWKETK